MRTQEVYEQIGYAYRDGRSRRRPVAGGRQRRTAKSFKMAVGDAHGAPHELGKKFVELFEQKTGGKHTAKMFLNGQLGSEQDTINDAAIGTSTSPCWRSTTSPCSPTVGVFTLPYVILSLEDAEKLTSWSARS